MSEISDGRDREVEHLYAEVERLRGMLIESRDIIGYAIECKVAGINWNAPTVQRALLLRDAVASEMKP